MTRPCGDDKLCWWWWSKILVCRACSSDLYLHFSLGCQSPIMTSSDRCRAQTLLNTAIKPSFRCPQLFYKNKGMNARKPTAHRCTRAFPSVPVTPSISCQHSCATITCSWLMPFLTTVICLLQRGSLAPLLTIRKLFFFVIPE